VSDLIQRLREGADAPHLSIGQAWNLLSEAADELERLTQAAEAAKLAASAASRERDEALMQASVAGTETGAYWKGHDEAMHGVATRWQEALERPIPAPGAMNEPLESLYRRTERLRAERDALAKTHDGTLWQPAYMLLMEERDRLRAALTDLEDEVRILLRDNDVEVTEGMSCAIDIARDALKDSE
jgi:hypothetical protein